MAEIAQKHKDQLDRIKKNIQNSYEYFKENYESYNQSKRFVFISSTTETDQSINTTLMRPTIEFNILEAYISRLRGEFSKHVPSIEVSGKDGAKADPVVIQVLEDHFRYILTEANKDGLEYNCYTDTLTGGFSAVKVYTDYTSEMSFHQDIYIRRSFDPTLVGFDPLSRKEDKSDGMYCFECYPMREEEFKREFPDYSLKDVRFVKTFGSFNWSYQAGTDKVLMVVDYYEKKKKRKKIVMLTDKRVMTEEDYNKFIQDWESEGIIAQPPQIVGEPRMTELTSIVRYRMMETQVLEYSETDYDNLPFIFIDGNSILSKDDNNTSIKQMTRPYIYHATGAQKLKNYAGQALANELENMVQHKWMVSKDSIPAEHRDAYINGQLPSIIVYNAYKDDDPKVPLPPPQAVQRAPIPPEITNTFNQCDIMIQNILGSFDASMTKLTERDISGVAIQEATTLSNSAAMPYIVSYLKGLQAIADTILSLIPKIYKTSRTIPVLTAEGKKSYVKINQENGISFDYDKNALQVKIEAGINFNVQQERAFNQLVALMNVSPLFAEFMSTDAAKLLIDNVHFRGSDLAKELFDKFLQKRQEQQQQAVQNNPDMMKIKLMQQKMQMDAQAEQAHNQLKAQELQVDKQKTQAEIFKIMAELEESKRSAVVQMEKSHTEKVARAVDLAIKTQGHHHELTDKQFHRDLKAAEHQLAREIHERSVSPEKGETRD